MNVSRWASRLASLSVAGVLFALPGCLKSTETFVLATDGTGTATKKAVVDMSKMDQLLEMAKAMGGGGGGPGGAGGGGEDPAKEFDKEMNPEEVKKKLAGKKGI